MELSLKNIYKSFGAGYVLENVDFSLKSGEICALLGENGAGKSTLMNILGGVIPANSGEIYIDGKKQTFAAPSDSLNAGIAFIHQELNLVNDLTVYENMFLNSFPKKGLFLDKEKMISETSSLFLKLGINIDPLAKVGTLDASYKQMVEISRALLAKASVIIMDEPTTSLTAPEIERVFGIMRTLKSEGISMIFISHKLGEVMEICDRYCVLRNGAVVSSGEIANVTAKEIASYMVGHEIKTDTVHQSHATKDEILKAEALSDGKNFFDISFTLHKGEVLGVTGLLGDGRSELFQTVFGVYGKNYEGKLTLENKPIHPQSENEALSYGLAYLPRNRKENAIIKDMSILDNGTIVTLPKLLKFGFVDTDKQKQLFEKQKQDLRIKMGNESDLITSLSGGNQQKVVLAKWLLSEPKVLILDNPTQGVDVGAKEEIYSIIDSLAENGISVIVLSSEAQEIIRVCDRSLVMFHGRLTGEVEGESMNEQNMMYLATGAHSDNK